MLIDDQTKVGIDGTPYFVYLYLYYKIRHVLNEQSIIRWETNEYVNKEMGIEFN